eukprot:TRINITY_DN2855_c1_g1_i1.p1 TRINITY_DN2855_c1_g1~~TRINITY_DN2855_c1_g1_i1.p1  ORF type:complete len:2117 (-),score=255.99 TRINITY_DN2855_c1_g1_i1:98-6232(-)
MAKAIAKLAGVPADQVTVHIAPSVVGAIAGRRLRLPSTVEVTYTISVQTSHREGGNNAGQDVLTALRSTTPETFDAAIQDAANIEGLKDVPTVTKLRDPELVDVAATQTAVSEKVSTTVSITVSATTIISTTASGMSCEKYPEIDHLDIKATRCAGARSGESCTISCDVGYASSGEAVCHDGKWEPLLTCDLAACLDSPLIPNIDSAASFCAGTAFGQACIFSCISGYTASDQIICRSGGVWEHQVCLPNACAEEPNITHINTAETSCKGTPSDESCSIVCLPGFVPTSPVQCMLGGWISSSARCGPDRCDSNPEIPNQDTLSTDCSGTPSNSTCSFGCLPGFSPTGEARCIAGSWGVTETCVPSICETDPPIEHLDGQASQCEGTKVGDACSIVCLHGFLPQAIDSRPPGEVRCIGITWEEIVCEPQPCLGDPLIEGIDHAISNCDGTASGENCSFKCLQNYAPSGSALCYAGAWNKSAVCHAKTCTGNPAIEDIDSIATRCDGTDSGKTCAFTCLRGLSPTGDAKCVLGKWDLSQRCLREPCRGPPNILNMDVALTECPLTLANESCVFKCLPGYEASGVATCRLSQYDAQKCDPAPCRSDPDIANINLTISQCRGVVSGGVCIFECLPGYVASGPLSCSLGKWASGSCVPAPCGAPWASGELPGVDIPGSSGCLGTVSGGTCAFVCLPGFYPGTVEPKCSLGVWDDSARSFCKPKPCNTNLVTPYLAAASTACAGTESGALCEFKCKEPYVPTGKALCMAGEWDTKAKCDLAPCVAEPPVDNIDAKASPTCAGTPRGGTCAFKCLPGYRVTGEATCVGTVWKSPPCEQLRCIGNPDIKNMDTKTVDCAGTVAGAKCPFTCVSGYKPAAQVACSFSGQWETAVCNFSPCFGLPSIANIDNEASRCDNTASGSMCAFKCLLGYRPSAPVLCSLGVWDVQQTCEPLPCAGNPVTAFLDAAATHCQGKASGQQCVFTCTRGYKPSAPSTCSLGKWDKQQCLPDAPCNGAPNVEGIDATSSMCDGTPSLHSCAFKCLPDYTAVGVANCIDGVWDSEQRCTPNPCAENPSIEFFDPAASHCRGTPSGESCIFGCLPGYHASGVAVCKRGVWDEVKCLPPTPCRGSPLVENIDKTASMCDGTESGKLCAFRCFAGFSPTGAASCHNGIWDDSQKCLPKRCSDNPPIEFIDEARSSCKGTFSGGSCAFVCLPGYEASGTAVCKLGEWDSQSCIPPSPCAGLPDVPHLDKEASSCDGTKSGGSCAFKCLPGFTPSGASSCTDGAWGTAQTCTPNACSGNPAIEFIDQGLSNCASTPSGGTCSVVCLPGYRVSGVAHCNIGAWDAVKCITPEPCLGLPDIKHIDAEASKCDNTPSSGSCVFRCKSGYAPTGPAVCTDGSWGTHQECEPNGCSSNPEIEFIDAAASKCQGTFSGGNCAFKCLPGYRVSGVATCLLGTWDTAKCIAPAACYGSPSVQNLDTQASKCDGTESSASCAFTCVSGYTATGVASCFDGVWSNENKCTPNPCSSDPPVDFLDNAATQCEGTPSGGTCTIVCKPSYRASGPATCSLGAWDVQTCIAPDPCTGLPSVQHIDAGASGRCAGTLSGQTCVVRCMTGYVSTGASTCFDGVWSTEQKCTPQSCNSNPPVDHLDNIVSQCAGTASGSTCAFTCMLGYSPSGDAACSLASWTEPLPTCKPDPCSGNPMVLELDQSATKCDGTPSGQSCDLKCKMGFLPTSAVLCTVGAWKVGPECLPSPCSALPAIMNMDVAATSCKDTASGETCAFKCLPGFVPSGVLTCIDNLWDSQSCLKQPCTGKLLIDHMDEQATNCESVRSGHTCAFKCLPGYQPSGVVTCNAGAFDTQTCQEEVCFADPVIANIDADASACKGTKSGATCAFKCVSDFTPSGTLTCSVGKWSTHAACTPIGCAEQPSIAHIDPASTCKGTKSGAGCFFHCLPGYSPSSAAICNHGKWEVGASCKPNACSSNPQMTNIDDQATHCKGLPSGEFCVIACLPGFKATGKAVCTAGSWDLSGAGQLRARAAISPISCSVDGSR